MVRNFTRISLFGLSALAIAASPAAAQDASQCFVRGATLEEAVERASPLRTVAIIFEGAEGTLCYGAPSARERTVMGELVPFGSPWRTGANEATALHLPFGGTIGGVAVEPGSYSIITIPGAESWEIIINRNVERWGIPVTDELRAADVGSFSRAVEQVDEMVETLTFRWESHGAAMGHLVMEWEHTRVQIPIHMGGGHHSGH